MVGATLEDFARKCFCAKNLHPIVFVGLTAMALDQKAAEWLPLHVALAWVFTRDENFTYQVARFANPNLEIALNLYRYASDDDGAPPVIENETEAWRQLRQAISASSVRARGVPYDLSSPPKDKLEIESRPPKSELEELEAKLDEWERRHMQQMPKVPLPAAEVASLVPEVDFRQVRLRPEDPIFSGGRRWQNVEISRDDLHQSFPKSEIPKPFDQPRAHRRNLAKEALVDLYGQGGPGAGVTEERRYQDVDRWVRGHGEPKGVSKATVRRAIKDLRSHRGDTDRS